MFVLGLHITITTGTDTITFTSAKSVRVKKSVLTPVITALLEVPTSARLIKDGKIQTESVQTAKTFNAGDKIEIKAGYDGQLVTEFTGFIKRINFTTPCQIECEGYSYKLRRTDLFNARYQNAKVKSLLTTILKDTGISLHPDSQDITVTNLHLSGKNALEAIVGVMSATGCVAFFPTPTELYVGLKYGALANETVNYKMGVNVIKSPDLKYRTAEDQKAYYNITYQDSKGKVKHTSFGTKGGETFNYNFGAISDVAAAKALAQVKSSSHIYEGYEGKMTTFLQPYCAPSYTAHIMDDNYNQREGDFIVTGTELIVNRSGGRRIIEVGPSITFLTDNKY